MLRSYSKRQHGPAADSHELAASQDGSANDDQGADGSTKEKKRSIGSHLKEVGETAKTWLHATKAYISLEHVMKEDLADPSLFPEVTHQAFVRRGLDLCQEEQAYLEGRETQARDHFAAYMGLDPAQVHPDDVPTVVFGGSGGGYRAMLAVLGYARAMKLTGLWPLLAYMTGVSGSCWAIAAYFTFAGCELDALVEHCKKRLSPHHPLSAEAIRQVLGQPHGEYQTLGPLIEKHSSGLHTVAMDLYSVFTTGHLFAQEQQHPDPMTTTTTHPDGTAEAEMPGRQRKGWWKWTSAQQYLRNNSSSSSSSEPLPILTAIRHERPWKDWADAEHPFSSDDPSTRSTRARQMPGSSGSR
jgi:phospholipase A2